MKWLCTTLVILLSLALILGGISCGAKDTTPPTTDTTPPTISSITTSGMTTSSVTITWITNEGASSQVEYGATSSYGSSSALDSSMVTTHTVNLTGLTAGTTYHYRVKSGDATGNEALSKDQTFSTLLSSTSIEVPQPRFLNSSTTETTGYSPFGDVIGWVISKKLINSGGAGEVFADVSAQTNDYHSSLVFHMDEGEALTLCWSPSSFPYSPGTWLFKITLRAALPADVSQGEIWVKRSNSNMKTIGHMDIGVGESIQDVIVSGNYVYALLEKQWPYDSTTAFMADVSLLVIDVSDPSNPKEVGHFDFGSADVAFAQYGLSAKDNCVYVAIGYQQKELADNGLHIIDVSDPSNPHRIGQYHTDTGACDVALSANCAYVATRGTSWLGEPGLLVLDVSTPSNPIRIAQLTPQGDDSSDHLYTIDIEGTYAYLADQGHLHVFDISTPSQPVEVAEGKWDCTTTGTGKYSVVVRGTLAYVSTTDSSLVIFDVATITNPTLLGEYTPDESDAGGYEVSLSEKYAYIAAADALKAIDISNPSAPAIAGGSIIGGLCVTVDGQNVYLGANDGLWIFEGLS